MLFTRSESNQVHVDTPTNFITELYWNRVNIITNVRGLDFFQIHLDHNKLYCVFN